MSYNVNFNSLYNLITHNEFSKLDLEKLLVDNNGIVIPHFNAPKCTHKSSSILKFIIHKSIDNEIYNSELSTLLIVKDVTTRNNMTAIFDKLSLSNIIVGVASNMKSWRNSDRTYEYIFIDDYSQIKNEIMFCKLLKLKGNYKIMAIG